MFSSRTRWDLTPNRLSALLAAKRRAGTPVLDLTESNPTQAGFPTPPDVLATLADPAAAVYVPEPQGLLEARQAVSADYARRGARVDPQRILLTASTSEAYALLFKLLCDPGDCVLVPRPSYPLFEYLAGLESLEIARYPLTWDGEWHLSPATVAAALPPRTRAVVVVNPNNPTGSYLKRDEASGLQGLCAERGIALISDEVFADYAFREDARRVTTLAEDGPALAFAMGGLSKACGLPQLKLGWLAVSGPAALRTEALARLEIVADTYLSVATPVQRAAPHLLARQLELQTPIAARLRQNRGWLRERIPRDAPVSLLDAEGGWYAVLRVPATLSEEERVFRLLETRDVFVHPGFFFDFESEAFLVVSLLTPPDVFVRGIERVLPDLVL
jgi:hypothetical protein